MNVETGSWALLLASAELPRRRGAGKQQRQSSSSSSSFLSFPNYSHIYLPIMSDSKISLEGKVAIVTGAGNGLGRA